ncbi:lysoplasmalogenase [Geomicrobium sp. JCM 19038]|uniref:lysoplasmalogenase n=1 Tax=Geomicrobium sp. JCM 19038 TaxID=1460635 RepID=UPI00045F3E39|nr:lysoplasmalogenase [Geomicrobium sp. JCM 19038]GAK07264.1 putative membrane protein [Geomicrobium sp. JCM 19038]
MTNRLLSFLILLSGLLYIFIIPNVFEQSTIIIVFKVIPVLLIILYGLKIRERGIRNLVMYGLIVCAIADVAIVYSFLAGLVIFLLGHLLYIPAFWKYRKHTTLKWPFIAIAIYMGSMGWIFGSTLIGTTEQSLVLPVFFYIIVIGLMGIVAIKTRNRLAIIGALFFILSDSILAWNKFVEPLSSSHILIMSTYYAAQYCIARSRL